MTDTSSQCSGPGRARHSWLKNLELAYVPGPTTPLLERFAAGLMDGFERLGHRVRTEPTDESDALITTALFGVDLPWRRALLFRARRRFGLSHLPTLFTLIHATRSEYEGMLDHFARALAKDPPDLADYAFSGLVSDAWHVLVDQGLRGGPVLSLERLLQSQSKSIRIILTVGDDEPEEAYHFDLVGGHPRSDGRDPDAFYEDIALRLATTVSTLDVTAHQIVGDPVSEETWRGLATPAAMRTAGRELGHRGFFTSMIRIADLVHVPAVSESVASQYSEGCFATWDATLGALVATVTGSARPVDKGNLRDDDLSVIVGVRPDATGALTRDVEGLASRPPSSEAVEMMDMDADLPTIQLDDEWTVHASVPVARSKLHGHRGMSAYDPRKVEYAPLDPPYYHYPVSCATDAQARGIRRAFSRARSLADPEDPRQVAFTVLPGHGVMIAEKWVPGKVPFQVIWEYMDAGYLQIDNEIAQGPMEYSPRSDGRSWLKTF